MNVKIKRNLMTAITIIISVLAAAAAIFAVMFFQDRKDAKKYESKAESLSKELNDLRCDLARREISGGEAMIPLTRENIAEFLKMKTTGKVDISEDENMIFFVVNGEPYHIDCARLPQQFMLRKTYFGTDGACVHWDILEQAAIQTMKDLVMVKIYVSLNEGYGFSIVSTTHTIAALREDYDFFISLIFDAERKLREEYWKIMEIVHPEECVDKQHDVHTANIEDIATKMAQMSADQSKMQS